MLLLIAITEGIMKSTILVCALLFILLDVGLAGDYCIVPLYRYRNIGEGDYLYTTDPKEFVPGWADEGIEAKIFNGPVPGTDPLLRYYNPDIKDHFYTTNAWEIGTTDSGVIGNNGYILEGITGYCYPAWILGTIPLHRFYSAESMNHFYTTNPDVEIGTSIPGQTANGYVSQGVTCYVFPRVETNSFKF